MKRTTIVLEDEFYGKVSEYCKERAYNYSKLVRLLLEELMNEEK